MHIYIYTYTPGYSGRQIYIYMCVYLYMYNILELYIYIYTFIYYVYIDIWMDGIVLLLFRTLGRRRAPNTLQLLRGSRSSTTQMCSRLPSLPPPGQMEPFREELCSSGGALVAFHHAKITNLDDFMDLFLAIFGPILRNTEHSSGAWMREKGCLPHPTFWWMHMMVLVGLPDLEMKTVCRGMQQWDLNLQIKPTIRDTIEQIDQQ